MADYNTVEIDGIFLTTTGDDTGRPCRVEVNNLAGMRLTHARRVRNAIDGTPRPQFRTHKGRQIPMKIRALFNTNLDDLADAINDTEAADQVHSVSIEGDLGNFDLDCVLVSLESSGEFSDGRIYDFDLVWAVHTVNSIT